MPLPRDAVYVAYQRVEMLKESLAKMNPLPILEHMPEHIHNQIMSNLETKDLMSCRRVCRKWKNDVDRRPLSIREIVIAMSGNGTSLLSNKTLRIYTQRDNNCYIRSFHVPTVIRQRAYRQELIPHPYDGAISLPLTHLGEILQLWPQLTIDTLRVLVPKSTDSGCTSIFIRRFKSTFEDRSLKVRRFAFEYKISDTNLVALVRKLRPGVLKELEVLKWNREAPANQAKLFEVMELEQFRQLEEFDYNTFSPIDCSPSFKKLTHLKRCKMEVSRMTVVDAEFWVKACSNLHQELVRFRVFNVADAEALKIHFNEKTYVDKPFVIAANETHYMKVKVDRGYFEIEKFKHEDQNH